MIYDYYEYYELVYNFNKGDILNLLRLKFMLTQTTIVSTGIELYYKKNNEETSMGNRHLIIQQDEVDSIFQFGFKKLNAMQYGDAETESEYGFYNLQFGLLLFKYDNVIWRRIF